MRRFHAAYDVGDAEGMLVFCTPEIQFVPDAAVFPEAEPVVGRERVQGWIQESTVAWVNARYPLREVSEIDDDRVLIRGEWGGTGIASGVEMLSSLSAVYTLEHDRISRVEYFFDHEQALKAVGLEE